MTKLPEKELKDLIDLANARVEDAINSVEQLVEDPEQVHLMLMGIIASLCLTAADFLCRHTTGIDHPKRNAIAYFKVLSTLSRCGDTAALAEFMRQEESGR